MINMKKLAIILLILSVLIITSNLIYNSILNEFESTSDSKATLIREYLMVSNNIIDGLATYGNTVFKQGIENDSIYYKFLKYDSGSNSYYTDSAKDASNEKLMGSLTGLGPIPVEGEEKVELNLVLDMNEFFVKYYELFPDVAWLYYTSENDFINIFPWISSDEYRYSKQIKRIEFYTSATPENNPLRERVWTPVYLDSAGKGLMVTLSAPIYRNDTFKGVVSLDLTNAWLNEKIESEYESYLLDKDYTVLATSQKKFFNNRINHLDYYLDFSKNDIDTMMKLQEDKIHNYKGYYIYITGFKDAPWKMILLIPVWQVVGKAILFTLPILLISILLYLSMNQIEKRKKSETQLKKKKELIETTLHSIDEGIIVTDQFGKITLLNKMAAEYTGWTNEEALGKEFQEVFHSIDIISRETRPNPVLRVLLSGEILHTEANSGLVSKDGAERYISGTVSGIISESGQTTGAVVSFRDITKEYEQEKQIEGFMELNLDMFCVVDLDGNYHKINRKFEEAVGYRSRELEGKSFLSYVHDDDVQKTLEAIRELVKRRPIEHFVNRFRCKDGTHKYLEWHIQPRIGKFVYSTARDVTDQILRAEKLEIIAGKDQLTGVYNRHFFDSIITEEMKKSDYFGAPLSIALIDMDRFKLVNDTWGHPIGDEVLKQTAQVIEETIRVTDILIRFGGEEFLLLMPQTPLRGAMDAAEKVRIAIENKHHPVAGRQTASIGVSEKEKYESFISWYKRVDVALYKAKENGRNRVEEETRK